MARDLTAKKNVQHITDAIGGQVVQLHYRLPTTTERFGFAKACLVQDGDELKYDVHPARLEYGLKILTGFQEGDFAADGRPISADPQSPNYREDWKALLEETSSDLICALGMAVFEGARLLGPKVKADPAPEQGKPAVKEDGEPPLPNSSGG